MDPYAALSLAYMQGHPDLAAARLERLTAEQMAAALALVPSEVAATLLERMAAYAASAGVAALPLASGQAILQALPVHTASRIVRRMPRAQGDRLLAALPDALTLVFRRLLQFPEHTVGASLDPLVTALPADTPASDAIAHVRAHPDHVDHELFVVGRDQILGGSVALRALVAASADTPLGSLAVPVAVAFSATADLRALVRSPAWAETHTVPVVDATGEYLGALRYDAVMRLEEDEARTALPGATTGALLHLNEVIWTGSVRFIADLAGAVFERSRTDGGVDNAPR